MAIRVVTDSSCDLPMELAQQWDITVVPCYVVIDDVNHRDGVDITADDFYQRLASAQRFPSTAQPSVSDFQEVYQDLIAQGRQIISIQVSGKLSGTLNSAQQARASLGESASLVEVIDSQLASIPLGMLALVAARLAQKTDSLQQVAEQLQRYIRRIHGYFLLDSLEYLQKGGRIGKAKAFVGSLLNVKPLLAIQDGEAHPIERPRNRQRGIRRLVEVARQQGPVEQLAVIYSTELELAVQLKQELSDLLPLEKIIISRFGSTLGTYLGPKAIGIALTTSQ